MIRITVIGSSGNISAELNAIAEKLGQELARSGAIIITGGRDGVMEAVSRGAKNANGITVGILPQSNDDAANPYIDISIPTGLGFARNYINVISSDVIISLAGSGGTLSEIGYALALQKRLILMKGTGGVTDMIINNLSLFKSAKIFVAKNVREAVSLSFAQTNNDG